MAVYKIYIYLDKNTGEIKRKELANQAKVIEYAQFYLEINKKLSINKAIKLLKKKGIFVEDIQRNSL